MLFKYCSIVYSKAQADTLLGLEEVLCCLSYILSKLLHYCRTLQINTLLGLEEAGGEVPGPATPGNGGDGGGGGDSQKVRNSWGVTFTACVVFLFYCKQ
jgi:hypothetical protein